MMPQKGMDEGEKYTEKRFVEKGFQGSNFFIEDANIREEIVTAIESFITE